MKEGARKEAKEKKQKEARRKQKQETTKIKDGDQGKKKKRSSMQHARERKLQYDYGSFTPPSWLLHSYSSSFPLIRLRLVAKMLRRLQCKLQVTAKQQENSEMAKWQKIAMPSYELACPPLFPASAFARDGNCAGMEGIASLAKRRLTIQASNEVRYDTAMRGTG